MRGNDEDLEPARTGERRLGPDRRRRPTPMLSRYTFIGRRRGFRRAEEGRNAYVDRYSPRTLAVIVTVMALCMFDAMFTLLYIQRGGGELNPLMNMAIQAGVFPFLLIKTGLTAAGMLFLALHKNFRYVKGLVAGVFALYVALAGYHVYLAQT